MESKIVRKSWNSPSFKAKVPSTPQSQLNGLMLKSSKRFRFHQGTPFQTQHGMWCLGILLLGKMKIEGNQISCRKNHQTCKGFDVSVQFFFPMTYGKLHWTSLDLVRQGFVPEHLQRHKLPASNKTERQICSWSMWDVLLVMQYPRYWYLCRTSAQSLGTAFTRISSYFFWGETWDGFSIGRPFQPTITHIAPVSHPYQCWAAMKPQVFSSSFSRSHAVTQKIIQTCHIHCHLANSP